MLEYKTIPQVKVTSFTIEVSDATTYRSKCKSKDRCSRLVSRYCHHSQPILPWLQGSIRYIVLQSPLIFPGKVLHKLVNYVGTYVADISEYCSLFLYRIILAFKPIMLAAGKQGPGFWKLILSATCVYVGVCVSTPKDINN